MLRKSLLTACLTTMLSGLAHAGSVTVEWREPECDGNNYKVMQVSWEGPWPHASNGLEKADTNQGTWESRLFPIDDEDCLWPVELGKFFRVKSFGMFSDEISNVVYASFKFCGSVIQ